MSVKKLTLHKYIIFFYIGYINNID